MTKELRFPGDPNYVEDEETRVALNISHYIISTVYSQNNLYLLNVKNKRTLQAAFEIAANFNEYVNDTYGGQITEEDREKIKEIVEIGGKQTKLDFHETLKEKGMEDDIANQEASKSHTDSSM